jgi:ribosomal protein S12 methylthiotransferase accessory factor
MQMTTRFPGGVRVDTAFDAHVVRADQSISAGGEDAYPSPFELFLASIGSCTGYYVLAFCRQRGLATNEIEIVQEAEYDQQTHLVTDIRLEIRVPDDFPEHYRDPLVRAAGQCTVKKHLETPPRIAITTSRSTAAVLELPGRLWCANR